MAFVVQFLALLAKFDLFAAVDCGLVNGPVPVGRPL